MFRSLSSRLSFRSSQPSSSSSLTEHQSQSFSNKVFKEEIHFEDINQELDNWEIPKRSPKELYKPGGSFFHRSDNIIRTVEQKFKLKSDDEEIHLLSEKSIKEHLSKKYNYMHIGSVQIGLKPLTRGSLDVAVLFCLRDIRHNRFHDSLLGRLEESGLGYHNQLLFVWLFHWLTKPKNWFWVDDPIDWFWVDDPTVDDRVCLVGNLATKSAADGLPPERR
jgi:hypothetical protein